MTTVGKCCGLFSRTNSLSYGKGRKSSAKRLSKSVLKTQVALQGLTMLSFIYIYKRKHCKRLSSTGIYFLIYSPLPSFFFCLTASYGNSSSSDDRDYEYNGDQRHSLIKNPEYEYEYDRGSIDLHSKNIQTEILLQLEEAHRSGELSSDVLVSGIDALL